MKLSPNHAWNIQSALGLCLALFFCAQASALDEADNPHARRVEQIKRCTHSVDEPCPHGRLWHVDNQADNASDDNDGTEKAPFASINKAAQLALPGDTVVVGAGVYREHVSPAHTGYDVDHMINYVARDRHKVIIKGSEVWEPNWQPSEFDGVKNVWRAQLDPAQFTYDFPIENFNPFVLQGNHVMVKPEELYQPTRPWKEESFPAWVRGMIFMDGRPLRQVGSLGEFASGSDVFFVARDGKSVLARFADDNPKSHEYEITTREQVFAPKSTGVGFIRLKGFVCEHAATAPSWAQYGMVSPNSSGHGTEGWHWIIEDNILRWSFACAMDIGYGYWGPRQAAGRTRLSELTGPSPTWSHWIRGNEIVDNGQAGIWSIGFSNNAIIEYNRIERNGWLNNIHMIEAAGIKMHGCRGVVIRGNLVRDNDNFGIWLDVAGGNNRVTQNLVLNNMTAGIFIEGMWGHTLVDNNVSAFTRNFAFYQMNMGDGFYNHQASHVTFAHNLAFGNAGYGYRCLMWGLSSGGRKFPDGKMRVSHNRVLNNIAYANGRGAICLPLDQPHCRDNQSDYNFIWGASGLPMFELGRAIMPPDEMVATVEKAILTAGVGRDQVPFLSQWKTGEMGPNVGDMRHFGPRVSLPVWQAAEQRDMHSVIGPLPTLFLTRAGQMRVDLTIPEKPRGRAPGESEVVLGAVPDSYRRLDEVECPTIAEVTHDYFGNPRPDGEKPTVGPFQNMIKLGQENGEGVLLHLWPLDVPRQQPAESLRLARPEPELDAQEKVAGETYLKN